MHMLDIAITTYPDIAKITVENTVSPDHEELSVCLKAGAGSDCGNETDKNIAVQFAN